MPDCTAACPLGQHRASAPPTGAAQHSRRAFVSQAVLASVGAFLVAGCGDGNIGGVTGPQGSEPKPIPGGGLVVTIADFPALAADGGMARVDGGTSTPIAVTRIDSATYLAFSMVCPHAGYRPIGIIAGVGYKCPNHGAEFDPDGNWSGGQRTFDLKQYVVVHDVVAGTLTIT